MMKSVYTVPIAIYLILGSSSLRAAETWECAYSSYRAPSREIESTLRIESSDISETSGDVIVSYHILENSDAAIVAAKGGSYASEPKVMGFLLMLRKDTGDFVLATASTGDTNARQTGKCWKH